MDNVCTQCGRPYTDSTHVMMVDADSQLVVACVTDGEAVEDRERLLVE